jgi:uncharacterized protein
LKKAFLDTNLFIRYLTNDDPEKAERVARLLEEAARGEVLLVTAELVLAEVVWVLESAYDMTKKQIAPLIRGILATPGLDVINGRLVAGAIDLYESQNVDFTDGYVVAVMEKHGIGELLSFDRKHRSRSKKVRAQEP